LWRPLQEAVFFFSEGKNVSYQERYDEQEVGSSEGRTLKSPIAIVSGAVIRLGGRLSK